MATSTQLKLAKELEVDAAKHGVPGLKFTIDRVPKHEWWKPDGTKMPFPLPSDHYHQQKYTAHGWTLYPPTSPVAAAPAMLVGVNGKDAVKVEKAQALGPTDGVLGFQVPDGAKPEEVDRLYRLWLERYQGTVPKPEAPVISVAVAPPIKEHLHRFTAPTVGSACVEAGCPTTRRHAKHIYQAVKGRK